MSIFYLWLFKIAFVKFKIKLQTLKNNDEHILNNQKSTQHQPIDFYATLPYIRHFILAGCYDNNPCYLVTNLAGHLDFAGHLDLAGFYFSKCPANCKCPANPVNRYQLQACIVIL
jgi:hypothetical protein